MARLRGVIIIKGHLGSTRDLNDPKVMLGVVAVVMVMVVKMHWNQHCTKANHC